ncbi:hypothetical protein ACFQZZ_21250 [Nocardia sp. GCM10030253]|uniref:hypothetical protein n=1 Tax=Nocardia sp. GCM10030253 TaxID=3273404 RepID=UPI00364067B6
MTFSAVRFRGIRVVAAFAVTLWALTLALPECHLFPPAGADHAHIESSGPSVASPVTDPFEIDRHQHAAVPDQHLPNDAIMVTLPRGASSMLGLLILATALVFVLPLPAALGGGLRAPPSRLSACRGRDILVRIGIARI